MASSKLTLAELRLMWTMPRVEIDLMQDMTAGNDPFFARVVQQFCDEARQLHPKFPVVRRLEFGVAICPLPPSFEVYFMSIEAAARRNFKKASREGCIFRRIQFNDHLDAIREIRQSSEMRQGKVMPASYICGDIESRNDPESRNPLHAYPYFGVFIGDKLVAYASCLISGELCMIEQILGHAAFLEQSVVPYLIIQIGNYLFVNHRSVRYFGYGTYFGAAETLRRFKRKFGFIPHRVKWVLRRKRQLSSEDKLIEIE